MTGKRTVHEPTKRWINAVEIDTERNWKRKSLDRQVSRHPLGEAKAKFWAVMPQIKMQKKKKIMLYFHSYTN
jgi:hypothetical protein